MLDIVHSVHILDHGIEIGKVSPRFLPHRAILIPNSVRDITYLYDDIFSSILPSSIKVWSLNAVVK